METKKIFLAVGVCIIVVLTSCVTTESSAEVEPKSEIVQNVAPDQQPPQQPKSQPEAASAVPSQLEEEYMRSVSGMETNETVTLEEFTSDKQAILDIIADLERIMESNNYDAWLKYIEPASITYWQNIRNLNTASQRLPPQVRAQLSGGRIRTLREYFAYVFIPSRQGRTVDEIRYLSSESTKAVEVEGDVDIIYYNFKKIDGKWLLHLPAN